MLKKIVLGVVVLLVVLQFVPVDKENPSSDESKSIIAIEKPNEEIASILKTSCYDCHSNETVYPWYASVAPFSFILAHHVEEGREHLNFSEWANYDKEKREHKLEEMEEEVEEGEMPLSSYTKFHGDAELSKAQRETLIAWIKSIE